MLRGSTNSSATKSDARQGHPLGATGLAQCSELTWQLRGTADERQVDGAEIALQHNLGIGGACVVTMYKKGFDA